MPLVRYLPDLMAAERALGRFDAALADRGRARRLRLDGARRSALALLRLEGGLADAADLAMALASPADVDRPRRADALHAAGLYRLLAALHDGLPPGGTAPDPEVRDRRWSASTLAAHRPLLDRIRADVWAGLDLLDPEADPSAEPAARAGHAEPAAEWTVAWVEQVHQRWTDIVTGRPGAPFTQEQRAAVQDVLLDIERALAGDPGLAGAARALHRLHWAEDLPAAPRAARPATEDDAWSRHARSLAGQKARPAWWAWFARLTAPALLRRACRLDQAWLPVAVAWGREAAPYRAAVGGSEDDWVGRFARLVADLVEEEFRRSAALEDIQARWIEATRIVKRPVRVRRSPDARGPMPSSRQKTGSRRRGGKLPLLLDWLWEQPVVSVRQVEATLGISYKNAAILVGDLVSEGILAPAVDRKVDRLWRAGELA